MLYLGAVLVVLGVNLLPAFGPPTWAVLVLFKVHWHLNPVALVVLGACAAGTGRYLLAWASFRLRGRLSQRRRDSLLAAQTYLRAHRGGPILGLGLFALSPLPSAQLFEAAGVLGLPLKPLTAAFFAGRVVSYSLYIGAAGLAEHSLGSLLATAFSSPVGVAIQIAMVLGVAAIMQIDWQRLLSRSGGPRSGP
jgi:hypothetical protein